MKPYYEREDVTLYLGDCREVLPAFPEGSVEAVITDPPYSSGGMYRADRTNQTTDEKYTVHQHQGRRPNFTGDNMDQRAWCGWCVSWMGQARRVTAAGGYLCCFTDWRQLPTLTDAVQWAGWVWRGLNVWDKTEAAKGPHLGYFGYQCEFIAWATHGPCLDKPTLAEGGEGRMPGCHRRAVSKADKFHQTGKPTDVMGWLVKCCPPGRTVLDPFVGSGTTLVAARLAGRKAIGCEVEEAYCEVTARRLEQGVLAF